MFESVVCDDLITASCLHNPTALPERVFKLQGANVSNAFFAPVIKSISDFSAHLNVLGAFMKCPAEWIRNLGLLIRMENCFKAHRLHPWLEASAYSESVAQLVLPTERHLWLSELWLRLV